MKNKRNIEAEKKPMTKAEIRAMLPKKLNKLGKWFFSPERDEEKWVVTDWKAVMK